MANPKVLKVQLRTQQYIDHIGMYDDDTVRICAPLWVKKGLQELDKHIPAGTVLQLTDEKGKTDQLRVPKKLRLKHLMMIARNELCNRNGLIKLSSYAPLIQDRRVVLAIKDLVRQCIIIGKDKTTHIGGYPKGNTRAEQSGVEVIVIDQMAFDFRKPTNSGRLVLIGPNVQHGLLDDLIFERVVGEKKVSPKEAEKNNSGRYVKRSNVYFDTVAYERFVEQDFLLVCFALNCINRNNPSFGVDIKDMKLKFLRYGCGIFAGDYTELLTKHITRGIFRAMKRFFESHLQNELRFFEFPFYGEKPGELSEYAQRISNLCATHGMTVSFSEDDALQETDSSLVTATTNCANPHAMAGNTMGYTSSTDAMIAENLESLANKFSPILNTQTKGRFFDMNQIGPDEEPQVAKFSDRKPGSKRVKPS